jgi:late competence protein required for DNA uptake (superfamily II DNA/RNA helicase)
MTESESLTAEQPGKSVVSSDLGQWQGKLADYQEQIRPGVSQQLEKRLCRVLLI